MRDEDVACMTCLVTASEVNASRSYNAFGKATWHEGTWHYVAENRAGTPYRLCDFTWRNYGWSLTVDAQPRLPHEVVNVTRGP
jgi:hypothetical protein